MSIASSGSILARVVHGATYLIRTHLRFHSNAMTVRHLETLPAYLRRDIGLPDDVNLVDVVEHGLVRRAPDDDTCRDLFVMPHAA